MFLLFLIISITSSLLMVVTVMVIRVFIRIISIFCFFFAPPEPRGTLTFVIGKRCRRLARRFVFLMRRLCGEGGEATRLWGRQIPPPPNNRFRGGVCPSMSQPPIEDHYILKNDCNGGGILNDCETL